MVPLLPGLSVPEHMLGLTPGSVYVFSGSLDLDTQALAVCKSVLSDDERVRADRFKFEKDQNHFVAARGILRHLLGVYSQLLPDELQFVYAEKGKPELANGPHGLRFNVSHSHGIGAWAFVFHRRIGVDVEWTGRRVDVDSVGKRFFSEREWATLSDLSENERAHSFFLCWTRKEAFVKALGDGISFSLQAFDVSVQGEAKLTRVEGEEDPLSWTMHAFEPVETYVGAVAFDGKAEVLHHVISIS